MGLINLVWNNFKLKKKCVLILNQIKMSNLIHSVVYFRNKTQLFHKLSSIGRNIALYILKTKKKTKRNYLLTNLIRYFFQLSSIFFLSNSLVTWKFTPKVNKWSVQGSNHSSAYKMLLSLSIELSSQGQLSSIFNRNQT
jgi:hypothetical protein